MVGLARSDNLRKVSISIIWGAVENLLAYRIDAVLREFIGPFRHHFALAGIRRNDFNEKNAGIQASRFHAEKGRNVFLVGCTPNTDQSLKRVSCDQVEIPFLSASVTGRGVATFVKNLLLDGG